ncbi:hypothetical protein G7B40_037715 [Aetokthonos hydrillicola Thurmond2011]|jgi:hypothetical protein|uniref:Uncharacterized protein n=1 Tax=Aetokthonos hydrillicola Thurmond2011 TaxID=2712845 RepID=A0AAP5IEM2_9CYAN|nr:hypothetical protein [Aetokthonos hydrillicola]MBO3461193.1 hypothetical protein [Aetokthonos hydrillicola CCALA 1050]MBW4589753.1 hypothetical protein [Aetokthonos hydrillicola CCALA 1050]MDR9900248.1 hypothetical protein [Aetokthonos hydrillicola Thurmond2011]
MEPLTAGAIALLTLLGNKALNKVGDKVIDVVFEQSGKVIKLLRLKFPDTAKLIEAAAENLPLPPGQPEDIGEAVLIEKIESAASQDPEIKAAVEALASDAQAAAKEYPQLAAALEQLTEAVKEQRPNIINENWQGINFKNANPTISNNTFNFGSK